MTRAADQAATLLAEHGGRLFALLVRLTLRTDVAEDLMQELFCKLARSDGFSRADNPLAYAYRAATNLAFDWRRQRRPAATESTPTADELPGPDHSPLAGLVRREELDQVLSAIADLPPPGRDIVVLRHLERHSYKDIAQQLGKTPHQIRALGHKALERLRTILREPKRSAQLPREMPGIIDRTNHAEGVADHSPGSAAPPRHPGPR